MIISLSACSTNHSQQQPSDFSTNITPSGNKQFELSVWATPSTRLSHKKRGIDGKPQKASMAERVGRQQTTQQENKKQGALLDKRLQDILGHNHYCKNGYFILERSISNLRARTRGECNDAASAQDRQNFPNKQAPQITPTIHGIPAATPANPIGLSADQTL
jgi:hypothetical protein